MSHSACGTLHVRLQGPVLLWLSCHSASPVSFLGSNFSSFPGCSSGSLSFPPESFFLTPESFLMHVEPTASYTAVEIWWFPPLSAALIIVLFLLTSLFLGLPTHIIQPSFKIWSLPRFVLSYSVCKQFLYFLM